MTAKSQICVIGGGPAGLAAAIAAAQLRHQVTVVDRAVPPLDKACGEGLLPDSIGVLARLGIHVPAHLGFQFNGICFSDQGSSITADFPSGFGLGIRRPALHSLMLERARELGIRQVWDAKRVSVRRHRVEVDGNNIASDFVIGADGASSQIRRELGLHQCLYQNIRYGFRRHYRIVPWSSYVEVYWGNSCQVYVTPVGSEEIGVACLSSNPKVRLDQALAQVPGLERRLAKVERVSADRGALSTTRRLWRVCSDRSALVGDASGSVDAITGEGLCIAFKEALSLANAIDCGRLGQYDRDHTALNRLPRLMSRLLLSLDRHPVLRSRALSSLARHPTLFAALLSVHVGHQSFSGLPYGQVLNFCRTFLTA